mgnify:CR=1 FL=1
MVFTEIVAKYYLGLSPGKEIIDWANDLFMKGKDVDADFIQHVAFLDKDDKWETARAEAAFFDHFNLNEEEILTAVKRYLMALLEEIVRGDRDLYELVDTVSRMEEKYQQPEWINDLSGFCVYLMPDSTLIADSRLAMEINKTIDELKQALAVT